MKELSKITFQSLKENKTRTLFTFLSVFFSVFLLSSLIILNNSKTDYINRQDIYTQGEYQLRYTTNTQSIMQSVVKKDQINTETILYTQGFTSLEDETYLQVSAIQEPVQINFGGFVSGKYPENENEVMVSKAYAERHGLQPNDTLSLSITTINKEFNISELNTLSFHSSPTKEYTISGIFNGHSSIYNEKIAGQILLYSSNCTTYPVDEGFIQLKDITKEDAEKIKTKLTNIGIEHLYNEVGFELLFNEQDSFDPATILLLAVLCCFLIQMTTNIFKISFNEKKQFIGMLKSMGATNTQIYVLGFYELCFYAIVCIPLGILISYFAMDQYLNYLSTFKNNIIPFAQEVSISLSQITGITLFNIIFLTLSCFYPLFKLRNIKCIQLIKTDETKVSTRIKRTHSNSKHIERLITKRNQKRNKQAYHCVQLSILLSVILLICSSYFCNTSMQFFQEPKNEAYLELLPVQTEEEFNQSLSFIEDISNTDMIDSFSYEYLIYPGIDAPKEKMVPETVSLLASNRNIQMFFCASSDYKVSGNDAMIANSFSLINADKEKKDYSFFDFTITNQLDIPFKYLTNLGQQNKEEDFPIIHLNFINTELEKTVYDEENVFAAMPKVYCSLDTVKDLMKQSNENNHIGAKTTLILRSTNMDNLKQYLNTYTKQHTEIYFKTTLKYDTSGQAEAEKFYYYGMAIILVLISIIHTLCTMITSMMLRKKEYAVLLSMGLENKQLFNLIFYENCSAIFKGLVIGIPIGVLGSYMLYRNYFIRVELFVFPYIMVIAVSIGLLLLSLFVTMIGYKLISKSNISELLKE